jgi:hypothetical protein
MAHIQIDESPFPIAYTVGASPRTAFTVPGPFFATSDLVVTDGADELVLNTDYTVTGTTVDGGYSDGTVTLAVAVTSTTITIDRQVPVTRTTDFSTSGPLDIRALNTQIDKIVAMLQQQSGTDADAVETAAAAAAASAAAAAAAAASVSAVSDFTFTLDSSVDNTGADDVTAEIQALIDACEAAGGGRILLPPGTFLVNGGLTIGFSCAFEGCPAQIWKNDGHVGLPGTFGTYLKQTTTANSIITVEQYANGVQIRNVGFIQAHTADASFVTPTAYPPVILIISAATTVEHIMLYNVNKGIQLGQESPEVGSGFTILRDIRGAAFTWCIHIYKAGDFSQIVDCVFNGWTVDNNVNQRQYIQANAAIVYSGRNDSCAIHNLRGFGFKYGIQTYVNPAFPVGEGVTTRLDLVNINFDKTRIGMYLVANTSGRGANVTIIGDNSTGTFAIQCNQNSRWDFVNVNTVNHGVSAILAAETGVRLSLVNVRIDSSNMDGGGVAVYAAPLSGIEPAAIVTSSGDIQASGSYGAITGGGGTFRGTQTL